MSPSSGRDAKAAASRTDPPIVLATEISIETDVVLHSRLDDSETEDASESQDPSKTESCSGAGSLVAEPALDLRQDPHTSAVEHTNPYLRVNSDGSGEVPGEQCTPGRLEAATSPATGEDGTGDLRREDVALGKNVILLQSRADDSGNLCSVYIVGTAHISQDSCNEVVELIRDVKPQTVFLELCASRVAVLYPQGLEGPSLGDLVKLYRRGANPFGIVYSWVLARYAAALGALPGTELRFAYEEALKNGARVVLGDRPIQVTLERTWARLGTLQKPRLIFDMMLRGFFVPRAENLKKMIKELNETDIVTSIVQEMSGQYPSLVNTLLLERELYMAATLKAATWHRTKVVAVVGKGHLEGIAQNWEQKISLQKLLAIPRKSRRSSRTSIRWGAGALALCGSAVFIVIRYRKKT